MTSLDVSILKLNAKELTIISGPPAAGKTSFAINIILSLTRDQARPVAFFSYEMYYPEISLRLLSLAGSVPLRLIKIKNFSSHDLTAISRAISELSRALIFIHDCFTTTIEEITTLCHQMNKSVGLGYVVIDYLQLISTERTTGLRKDDLKNILDKLKSLASELEISVIIIAQGPIGSINILQELISNVGDKILVLKRGQANQMLLKVWESRTNESHEIELSWDSDLGSFSEISK